MTTPDSRGLKVPAAGEPVRCSRTACKRALLAGPYTCVHTQTRWPYCRPCMRKINNANRDYPELVVPSDSDKGKQVLEQGWAYNRPEWTKGQA